MNVRARHPRMQDIADDGHGQVGEIFFVVPDGVHVEQALRRVRVAAVTGIDDMHMRRHMLGDQVGRARLAVAHHKHVGGHGAEVGNGVQQRLALRGRGARDVQVDHVGRQAGGGNLKGGAGAGGVFKKQVENALAAQQRHFFDFAVAHTDEVGGGVQNLRQRGLGQAFGGEQVNQLAVLVELGISSVQHAVNLRELQN